MSIFSKKELEVFSPVAGKIIDLEEVDDEIFSKKIMGEGFAVLPEEGIFRAPVEGEISLLHDCHHAYGITTKSGVEVLTHIGIDTVKCEGNGFKPLVHVGSKVEIGDPIIEADMEAFKKEGRNLVTSVIVGNVDDYLLGEINHKPGKKDPVLKLKKLG